MVKFFRKLALSAILSVLPFSAWAEHLISVKVLDQKIVEGESFLISVSIKGKFNSYDLDTRPLAENFIMGDPEYKYDELSDSTSWTIPLLSHKSGSADIPSMLLGDNVSIPVSITVRPPTADSRAGELEQLIDTTTSTGSTIMGNETLIYRVRITKVPNMVISSVHAPRVSSGFVKLVDEREDESVSLSHPNPTIDRTYAVTFAGSGKATLYPPIVTGVYKRSRISGQRSKPGTIVVIDPEKAAKAASGEGVKFVHQAKPQIYTIKPIKGENVVVAENFKLREEWIPGAGKDSVVGVNTPITHKIIFSADNATSHSFPRLKSEGTVYYSAYEDKEEIKETYDPRTGKLHAELTIYQIYVPLKNMNLKFEPFNINAVSKKGDEYTMNVYSLTSPAFSVINEDNTSYTFKNQQQGRNILIAALAVIATMLLCCIAYLCYLYRLINIDPLINWFEKKKAKSEFIKKFDTKNPVKAYKQIISIAKILLGNNISGFEQLPNYEKYKDSLTGISEKLWNNSMIANAGEYDGSKFKKQLGKFCKELQNFSSNSNLRYNKKKPLI